MRPTPSARSQRRALRHWLGTDIYGRDQLSRIIYAARVDLLVALGATAIALSIGSVIGAVSGLSRRVDRPVIMRGVDSLLAFPAFILAMAITAALGNSVDQRGDRDRDHARADLRPPDPRRDAAHPRDGVRRGGAHGRQPAWRIIFHHLLPNCFPPVIVQATLAMGFAMLTVAALSFIGLGIQPPQSEWGAMTAEGAEYIVSGEWWIFLFPGLAIMMTVLSFNLVGDALRDLLDPRMKGV